MKSILFSALCLLLSALPLTAASSGYSAESSAIKSESSDAYQMGMDAVNKNDYAKAIDFFEIAIQNNPKDAEALNMLAYSERKMGRLENAFVHYNQALMLKPNFPQAREYLGEAHLEAALQEIQTLRGYGKTGEKDLQKLIKAFKDAAASL